MKPTTIVALAVALTLSLAAEAYALEPVRGRGTDAIGDSGGGPLQDLLAVEGQSSPDTGTLTLIASLDPSRSPQGSSEPLPAGTTITITAGQLDASGACPIGSGATATFRPGRPSATWRVDGGPTDFVVDLPEGAPPQNLTVGSTLFNQPELVGRRLNCVSASLTAGDPATLVDSTPVVAMSPIVYDDGKDPSEGAPADELPPPVYAPVPFAPTDIDDALIVSKRVRRGRNGSYVRLQSRAGARFELNTVRVTVAGRRSRSFTGLQLSEGLNVRVPARGRVRLQIVVRTRSGIRLIQRSRVIAR